MVDGAHNIIRGGWDGLARAQVATRPGPAHLRGGSCGLLLFEYGQETEVASTLAGTPPLNANLAQKFPPDIYVKEFKIII